MDDESLFRSWIQLEALNFEAGASEATWITIKYKNTHHAINVYILSTASYPRRSLRDFLWQSPEVLNVG